MWNVGVEVKPIEVQALETVECGKVMFELGEDIGGEFPSAVIIESDRPHVG